MDDAKRKNRRQEAVWAETKAAVHKYAENPCAATEQAVSSALHKVRDLHDCAPKSQTGARKPK